VTDRPCPLCRAALAPGVVICGGCHAANRGRLRDVPGLLAELDVTIARGGSSREGIGSSVRVDYDERASAAALALRTLLHGWVRVWSEETHILAERAPAVARLMSTTRGQAALLAGQQLASRPWAGELAADLRDASRAAWLAVDRPPDLQFVGWCPEPCGRALYALLDQALVTCRACQASWDVDASRALMFAAATGAALTKPDIARLLKVPVGTLHRWSSEGRIVPVWFEDGRPWYELEPVARAVRAGITPSVIAVRQPARQDGAA
jgi:hypothetical protein